MLRLKGTVCIEDSKEAIWGVLSSIENVSDWVDVIVLAKTRVEKAEVLMPEITCELKNKVTTIERWIA